MCIFWLFLLSVANGFGVKLTSISSVTLNALLLQVVYLLSVDSEDEPLCFVLDV